MGAAAVPVAGAVAPPGHGHELQDSQSEPRESTGRQKEGNASQGKASSGACPHPHHAFAKKVWTRQSLRSLPTWCTMILRPHEHSKAQTGAEPAQEPVHAEPWDARRMLAVRSRRMLAGCSLHAEPREAHRMLAACSCGMFAARSHPGDLPAGRTPLSCCWHSHQLQSHALSCAPQSRAGAESQAKPRGGHGKGLWT